MGPRWVKETVPPTLKPGPSTTAVISPEGLINGKLTTIVLGSVSGRGIANNIITPVATLRLNVGAAFIILSVPK